MQVADGTVAFDGGAVVESRLLKLPVDVRGEDERTPVLGIGPPPKDGESGVRRRGAIQVEPVAVEPPGELGVAFEPERVGHVVKRDAEPGDRRVSPPEALVASEIWQPRIDPHTGAG